METCSTAVRVLIDLDAILDTRLGAVSRLSPEAAVRIVQDRWIIRENDTWQKTSKEFTFEQYREIYFRREKETLMASGPTDITRLLFGIVQDYQSGNQSPDLHKDFELIVNLDRYPLTADETDELEAILLETMPYVDKIQFIRQCIKRMTPAIIRGLGATYYICYDVFTWIRANNDEIVGQSHLWLTVLAPAVAEHTADDFEDAEELKEMSKGFNPFLAFEFAMSINLNLRFCEVAFFSLTSDIKGGD